MPRSDEYTQYSSPATVAGYNFSTNWYFNSVVIRIMRIMLKVISEFASIKYGNTD